MTAKSERERLIEYVVELEEKMYRELWPIVPQEWLRVDLTMVQFKILVLLLTDGPARVGSLASTIGVSLASATGISDRLVRRGLIVRGNDPKDRRAIVCSLSEKGRELMTRLWESGQVRSRNLMEKMTLPKLLTISEALEAILDAAGTIEKDLHPVGDARAGAVPKAAREG